MERAEHQVPGLRRLDGDRHRLEVAHLADEDDVGVLAQRGAQRVLERRGVEADLALVHEALLVLVHELERVLDRDDVIAALAVHVVHQRAERGGLARARRPRDEDEPLRLLADLQQFPRQRHVLGRHDLARDRAEHAARALPVAEQVAAEARDAGYLVREVGVVALGELLPVAGGRDRQEEAFRVARRQRAASRHRLDLAVHAQHRRRPGAEVEVRCLPLDDRAQQGVHLGLRRPPLPAALGRSRRRGTDGAAAGAGGGDCGSARCRLPPGQLDRRLALRASDGERPGRDPGVLDQQPSRALRAGDFHR